MKLTVICETCNNQEVARCESDDPQLLGALIVSCHASSPHSGNHKLVGKVEGKDVSQEIDKYMKPVKLYIKCTSPNCGAPRKEITQNTIMPLVSGLCIAFHTEHEGHPLLIQIDGQQIHPPA